MNICHGTVTMTTASTAATQQPPPSAPAPRPVHRPHSIPPFSAEKARDGKREREGERVRESERARERWQEWTNKMH